GTQPTEASLRLRELASEVADVVIAELAPRAVLLTGSAAEGISDRWSDLDLIVYHDQLPPEAAIDAVRALLAGRDLMVLTPWDGDSYGQSFVLRGVECQLGHATVAATEREFDQVLVELDVDSPLQKAFDGMTHGIPLHGENLLRAWQARLADYPDGLRRAMVERHLLIPPMWMADDRMATRDATIFRHQMLVQAALNLLAVLAGLNRVYFSSFQFKRVHAFAARLALTPPDLAERLERLFDDPHRAGAGLEALVIETLALVERELPDLDTTRARRWVGRRPERWDLGPA
ncbi:MAG TPA: hypothetical protein VOB72_23505, partial [Candidatus Dormibacteraeota bacterium]|nr:hypothetical protein [Candidatus Dormibacteraeota bacterium]